MQLRPDEDDDDDDVFCSQADIMHQDGNLLNEGKGKQKVNQ